MHDVKLPTILNPSLDESTNRGKFFASFTPDKTALLVIDMQNHWVDKDGLSYIQKAREIVPNINRLADSLRTAGGMVVWVIVSFSDEGRSAWPMFFQHLENTDDGARARRDLTPGSPMHDLWPGMDMHVGDPIISKDRFSAFIKGSSNLEELLRGHGIDTVLITGVATNICCESTARDAMMLDFRTVMVEDANVARTDEDHIAALRTFAQVFGGVMSTDDVISRVKR